MPGLLSELYEKLDGNTFVIPTILYGPIVLVSTALVPEYRHKYDDEFSSIRAEFKSLHFQHVFPHVSWMIPKRKRPRVRALVQVLANVMAKDLSGTIAEITAALDENFGQANGASAWRKVPLCSTLLTIYGRNLSRIFVGTKFSGDENYVRQLMKTLNALIKTGMLLTFFPEGLRTLAARVICLPVYYQRRLLEKNFLGAMFEEKIATKTRDDEFGNQETYQTTFIAATTVDPNEAFIPETTYHVMTQFLTQHLGGTHTTAMKVFKVFGRLLEFPDLAQRLRVQAESTFANPERSDSWSKAELDQLTFFDSFICETMRFDPTGFAMLRRVVVKQGGFTFSDGTHVPQGFEVAVPIQQIHTDPKYYDSPNEFNPDRWMKKFEENQLAGPDVNEEQKFNIPFISTGFLSWGDGRHACPGRYFGSRVMKITLAYFVLNYEMKLESPNTKWETNFGNCNVPLDKAVLIRRKVSEKGAEE